MKANRSEKGQVLVLIILGSIVLFGVSALAVDGGMAYAARRNAQNAVDTAAMAAAYAVHEKDDLYTAAVGMMVANGFGDDLNPALDGTAEQDLQVYNPPISGPYATAKNKNEYIQVIYRTRLRKIFSQFVFMGPLEVTVEAVSHFIPTDSISAGSALHAVGRDVCPGIVFNGGSNTSVTGGNVFSNSAATNTSGSCASGIFTGTSGSLNVSGGKLLLSGSWTANDSAVINPPAQTNVDPVYLFDKTPPDCTGLPSRPANAATYQPGYYPNGITVHSGDHTFEPGLYCVDGNFTVNGGSVTGSGLMFYLMPSGGGVSLSGNALVTLATGPSVLDAKGENFSGFLFFMHKDNRNGLDLAGSNGSYFHGTVYAPGIRSPATQEKCNIGGNNTSIALNSNLICYNIGIAGNSKVTILYRPEENYRNPPMVELTQ